MSEVVDRLPPVRKQREVPLSIEPAFDLFTQRIFEWWPVAVHSIAGRDVVGIRFEGRVGGRVVEIARDGREVAWADVIEWEPPTRFVLAWHPSAEPAPSTRLELRFATVEGGTSVELIHDGWEAVGDRGPKLRADYEQGWDGVLTRFIRRASAASGGLPAT